MTKTDAVASAIIESLISPNEVDSNWESANVVDGLFHIGRGLFAVAKAINRIADQHAVTDEEKS